MRKFILQLPAICILLGAGAPSLAQTSIPADTFNPSWYVVPSIGLIDGDSRFGVSGNDVAGAIRFGKAISPDWDLQFGSSYGRQNNAGNRYRQTTLGADALYMLSRQDLRPFLLLGAGAQYDRADTALGQKSGTSPYLNAGIGLQYSFTDQFAIQADLRRVHGFMQGSDFNFKHANNNYLNVGLVFTFDKPVQRPRAPEPVPVPQPIPEPKQPPVVEPPPPPPPPRFEKVTLSATELFAFNSAQLSMPQPKLDEVANTLNLNTQVNDIVITGYTDRIGSDRYNMKLSERRANTVKQYLVDKGVSATRLTAQGKGKSNPVVQCNDKNRTALIACLEPNRRVEVEQFTIERRVR